MGGPNLEVFKFGLYIMFPIGIMYYFGTNLDSRFAVPDFWPKEGQTHTIPFEKDEIKGELERLRQRRLAARARRLAVESVGPGVEEATHQDDQHRHPQREDVEMTKLQGPAQSQSARQKGWLGLFGR